jgi:hypothetical protein
VAEVKGTLTVKDNLSVDNNAKFFKGLDSPYLELQDERNSDGGTFLAGAWTTRDLNVTVHAGFATSINLAAEHGDGADFTIPAGTYYIDASAPAVEVEAHITRLADATDAVDDNAVTVVLGTAEYAPDTDIWLGDGNQVGGSPGDPGALDTAFLSQTRSSIEGRFTVTRSTKLQIQHRCAVDGRGTEGFGVSGNFYHIAQGYVGNVFTSMRMWQISEDGG